MFVPKFKILGAVVPEKSLTEKCLHILTHHKHEDADSLLHNTPGPSGIVMEMIQAAGDLGASMIRDLAAAIIRDSKVPSDWEQSFIVCLYKGKGDALERGNCRGRKLTAGHESPREDCGRPHQTVGVN